MLEETETVLSFIFGLLFVHVQCVSGLLISVLLTSIQLATNCLCYSPQRMSVLVRKLPSEHSRLIHVFVKGAPEMIRRLSKPESIPEDFHQVLGNLTQRGYRVLALGFKEIKMAWHHAERLERSVGGARGMTTNENRDECSMHVYACDK